MALGIPAPSVRRAVYAIAAVAAAEIVGTVGFHLIEGAAWINAFYFESMLATGQGPPFSLVTNAGKIFASVMAFVSLGSVLSAVIFTLGPIMVRIWHEAMAAIEAEARKVGGEVVHDVRRIGRELDGGESSAQPPPVGPPR
jgi:hypothetical protein